MVATKTSVGGGAGAKGNLYKKKVGLAQDFKDFKWSHVNPQASQTTLRRVPGMCGPLGETLFDLPTVTIYSSSSFQGTSVVVSGLMQAAPFVFCLFLSLAVTIFKTFFLIWCSIPFPPCSSVSANMKVFFHGCTLLDNAIFSITLTGLAWLFTLGSYWL